MRDGKKRSPKFIALAVNHLVTNSIAWRPVSSTGEQKATSGDQ